AGWVVVRRDRAVGSKTRWAALAVVVLALAGATKLQETTLTTVLAVWLAFATAGAIDLRRLGSAAWQRSVPLRAAAFFGLCGAGAVLARPDLLGAAWTRAFSTPYWARPVQADSSFYLDVLHDQFPLIGLVGAWAFAYLLFARRRLGGYLLLTF